MPSWLVDFHHPEGWFSPGASRADTCNDGGVPNADEPIDLAIVNDYHVVIAGLSVMLEPYSHLVRVREIDANRPVATDVDVVLYDTFARTDPGFGQLRELHANPLVGRVVVFSWRIEEAQLEGVLEAGASGFLSKTSTAEQIVDGLVRIAQGEQVVLRGTGRMAGDPSLDWPGRSADLTAREAEILALITQGKSNREIAETLFLSINTIKSAIRTAYRKIGAVNRVEAVLWGTRNGMSPDVVRVDCD